MYFFFFWLWMELHVYEVSPPPLTSTDLPVFFIQALQPRLVLNS